MATRSTRFAAKMQRSPDPDTDLVFSLTDKDRALFS